MPAVILDAETLAAAAVYRDSPARKLLVLLSYGSISRYIDVGYPEEQQSLALQAGDLPLGEAHALIDSLRAQRDTLSGALPPGTPSEYWLVASKELVTEAREQ